MGFKRLEVDDKVISSDASTSPAWSNNSPTLTKFYSSSIQLASSTGQYYLNVYQTGSTDTSAAVQFDVAYCDKKGSGSLWYNNLVDGASPSRTNYGLYRNLILGDETADFNFGGFTSSYFYAISVERARFKEKLLPGTMTLVISGSSGSVSLTDDSTVASSVVFTDAGRKYQLISGSAGAKNSDVNSDGYTLSSGSYGWFLPDISTLLLNGQALDITASAAGGICLLASRSSNSDGLNTTRFVDGLNSAGRWTLNSEETLSSNYIFIRARNNEFNYSENPSYISGSTGELTHDLFINSPQTYITTIGLYNDANELLAVSKLSRPLVKDFTKELLVRCKLDF